MSAAEKRLLDDALRLDERERVRLALPLIESLEDPPADSGRDAAWASELTTRDQELETGSVRALSLEEAMAIVMAKGEPETDR